MTNAAVTIQGRCGRRQQHLRALASGSQALRCVLSPRADGTRTAQTPPPPPRIWAGVAGKRPNESWIPQCGRSRGEKKEKKSTLKESCWTEGSLWKWDSASASASARPPSLHIEDRQTHSPSLRGENCFYNKVIKSSSPSTQPAGSRKAVVTRRVPPRRSVNTTLQRACWSRIVKALETLHRHLWNPLTHFSVTFWTDTDSKRNISFMGNVCSGPLSIKQIQEIYSIRTDSAFCLFESVF